MVRIRSSVIKTGVILILWVLKPSRSLLVNQTRRLLVRPVSSRLNKSKEVEEEKVSKPSNYHLTSNSQPTAILFS